jgi:hypothetical protein
MSAGHAFDSFVAFCADVLPDVVSGLTVGEDLDLEYTPPYALVELGDQMPLGGSGPLGDLIVQIRLVVARSETEPLGRTARKAMDAIYDALSEEGVHTADNWADPNSPVPTGSCTWKLDTWSGDQSKDTNTAMHFLTLDLFAHR